MCDDVFELAGGVSQNLWAFLGNKVFESGTTPCQMYNTHTQKPNLEQHKVSRKSRVLQDEQQINLPIG